MGSSASGIEAGASPLVWIVVLNWNGWRHTLECLESLFRLAYPRYRVVVVDNASEDDSVARIRDWAEGRLEAPLPEPAEPRALVAPPVPKPIPYHELDRPGAGEGGAAIPPEARLILLQSGANLGFAGGCNLGLRLALANPEVEYVWLLNNDTVVRPEALDGLVRTMRADPGIGICGSTILFYHRPDTIQALGGGRYNPWIGFASSVGEHSRVKEASGPTPPIEYVNGASMCVSRPFLETVGLMTEEFFLYFEELDWACRAKGRFRLGHAPGSIVYHKEGATIGTSGKAGRRSSLSDYYMLRNRFRINRKYFPLALVTLYLWAPVMLLNRALRGQWDRLGSVVKAALWR